MHDAPSYDIHKPYHTIKYWPAIRPSPSWALLLDFAIRTSPSWALLRLLLDFLGRNSHDTSHPLQELHIALALWARLPSSALNILTKLRRLRGGLE